MSQSGSIETGSSTPSVKGAEQVGITQRIASVVGDRIVEAFEQRGRRVRVKGLRFIPSTKVELEHGVFQVLANAVVELAAPEGTGRAEPFETVVTVSGLGSQMLKAVEVPAFGPTSTEP